MLSESELSSFASRARYKFWTAEKFRFGDMDRNGHVNNVIFLALAECARIEFRNSISQNPDSRWVIGAQSIRYLAPAFYPGAVDIGTAVSGIGNTSFVLVYGMFQAQSCVAVASSRSVQLGAAGNPMPLDDKVKSALSDFIS